MTKIYFIRHGKTEWNLASRYQGAHGDSPLLPESLTEIKLLAKYLAPVKFAHAYVSPLLRAQTTAKELIAALPQPVPMTTDERLREFDLGKMEGMRFADVAKRWPTIQENFHHHADLYDEQIIGGESFSAVIARFKEAIGEYVAMIPEQNILVVSHGAALNAGINGLLGLPLAHLKDKGGLSNTSTTILSTVDGKSYQLLQWNETGYLHKTKVDPTDTI
ncbi:histidine phosphatase family protein [Lactobacillus alvi]|uniref:Histidine phosphatase family protein n=1 Tax=Limosilactobacillus alvi TaxID=990412 RepID=A0ABS2EMG8_9LACO|nr:histidine phosphatase family protein [Limosilactobacillus alvi]MBM6753556.1 histidine phosphatase family protein [Limosilactobacillus alvi]